MNIVNMYNIKDIFDEVSNQMSSELAKSRKSLNHSGMKGDSAEATFRDFLIKYLPNSLDVSTGILVDAEGQSSKQLDVIISDTAKTPIFYENNGKRVIPVECAYSVFEVKTKLNKKELENTFENIRSVRKLKKTAYVPKSPIKYFHNLYGKKWDIWPVNYFLFAYESTDPKKLLKQVESMYEKQDLPAHSRIDLICILNKGLICNSTSDGEYCVLPESDSKLVYVDARTSLLFFYTLIMSILNQTSLPHFNFTSYIKNIDLDD